MALEIRRKYGKFGHYGWRPGLPDVRDWQYVAAAFGPPSMVDLRATMPPIYDQGALGSCVSNAVGAAIEYDQGKMRQTQFAPSRLFIYYNTRVIEGTIDQDSGCEIRDAIKSVASLGAPAETDWPYDTSKFADLPPSTAYDDGKKDLVTSYLSVGQTAAEIRSCLADGFPVVVGFTVYDSFESDNVASTGNVPMPAPSENALGGHAVLVVGYNDGPGTFIVRNSWGTGWGDRGYFYMPYDYLANPDLSSDFWTVRSVSG